MLVGMKNGALTLEIIWEGKFQNAFALLLSEICKWTLLLILIGNSYD